jgi:hypothetical protein
MEIIIVNDNNDDAKNKKILIAKMVNRYKWK